MIRRTVWCFRRWRRRNPSLCLSPCRGESERASSANRCSPLLFKEGLACPLCFAERSGRGWLPEFALPRTNFGNSLSLPLGKREITTRQRFFALLRMTDRATLLATPCKRRANAKNSPRGFLRGVGLNDKNSFSGIQQKSFF